MTLVTLVTMKYTPNLQAAQSHPLTRRHEQERSAERAHVGRARRLSEEGATPAMQCVWHDGRHLCGEPAVERVGLRLPGGVEHQIAVCGAHLAALSFSYSAGTSVGQTPPEERSAWSGTPAPQPEPDPEDRA